MILRKRGATTSSIGQSSGSSYNKPLDVKKANACETRQCPSGYDPLLQALSEQQIAQPPAKPSSKINIMPRLFSRKKKRSSAKRHVPETTDSASRLFRDHLESAVASGLVYHHVFKEKKLGFSILIARYGPQGRKSIVVEETMPHCEIFPELLKPSDELIAINDKLILNPSEESFEDLKKSILVSKRPLKLTFIQGERREERHLQQEERRNFARCDRAWPPVPSALRAQSEALVIAATQYLEAVTLALKVGDIKDAHKSAMKTNEVADMVLEFHSAAKQRLVSNALYRGDEKEAEETVAVTETYLKRATDCTATAREMIAAASNAAQSPAGAHTVPFVGQLLAPATKGIEGEGVEEQFQPILADNISPGQEQQNGEIDALDGDTLSPPYVCSTRSDSDELKTHGPGNENDESSSHFSGFSLPTASNEGGNNEIESARHDLAQEFTAHRKDAGLFLCEVYSKTSNEGANNETESPRPDVAQEFTAHRKDAGLFLSEVYSKTGDDNDNVAAADALGSVLPLTLPGICDKERGESDEHGASCGVSDIEKSALMRHESLEGTCDNQCQEPPSCDQDALEISGAVGAITTSRRIENEAGLSPVCNDTVSEDEYVSYLSSGGGLSADAVEDVVDVVDDGLSVDNGIGSSGAQSGDCTPFALDRHANGTCASDVPRGNESEGALSFDGDGSFRNSNLEGSLYTDETSAMASARDSFQEYGLPLFFDTKGQDNPDTEHTEEFGAARDGTRLSFISSPEESAASMSAVLEREDEIGSDSRLKVELSREPDECYDEDDNDKHVTEDVIDQSKLSGIVYQAALDAVTFISDLFGTNNHQPMENRHNQHYHAASDSTANCTSNDDELSANEPGAAFLDSQSSSTGAEGRQHGLVAAKVLPAQQSKESEVHNAHGSIDDGLNNEKADTAAPASTASPQDKKKPIQLLDVEVHQSPLQLSNTSSSSSMLRWAAQSAVLKLDEQQDNEVGMRIRGRAKSYAQEASRALDDTRENLTRWSSGTFHPPVSSYSGGDWQINALNNAAAAVKRGQLAASNLESLVQETSGRLAQVERCGSVEEVSRAKWTHKFVAEFAKQAQEDAKSAVANFDKTTVIIRRGSLNRKPSEFDSCQGSRAQAPRALPDALAGTPKKERPADSLSPPSFDNPLTRKSRFESRKASPFAPDDDASVPTLDIAVQGSLLAAYHERGILEGVSVRVCETVVGSKPNWHGLSHDDIGTVISLEERANHVYATVAFPSAQIWEGSASDLEVVDDDMSLGEVNEALSSELYDVSDYDAISQRAQVHEIGSDQSHVRVVNTSVMPGCQGFWSCSSCYASGADDVMFTR